jgi:hypothetical protein
VTTAWGDRPVEYRNLLNPAFCSMLLATVAHEHEKTGGNDLPFINAFVVLPILLHRATRDQLPARKSAKLHNWIQQNSTALADFPDRATFLASFTREAILFGVNHGALMVDSAGAIRSVIRVEAKTWRSVPSLKSYSAKAMSLGRWMTQWGDPSTFLPFFGIRP